MFKYCHVVDVVFSNVLFFTFSQASLFSRQLNQSRREYRYQRLVKEEKRRLETPRPRLVLQQQPGRTYGNYQQPGQGHPFAQPRASTAVAAALADHLIVETFRGVVIAVPPKHVHRCSGTKHPTTKTLGTRRQTHRPRATTHRKRVSCIWCRTVCSNEDLLLDHILAKHPSQCRGKHVSQ